MFHDGFVQCMHSLVALRLIIHTQTNLQQVTLSKEGTSGEVGLEAGALVLSDQVHAVIVRDYR